VKPQADERLADLVSFGVLAKAFPSELVDDVVAACGRVERRSRLLSAQLTVYFVLGLALFSSESYEDIIRHLAAAFAWGERRHEEWRPPTKAALFKARVRLGPQVMKELFARVAGRPLGPTTGPGGLRVVTVDEAALTVPDTADNAVAFDVPELAVAREIPAWPRIRVMTLVDCGAQAILAAQLGAQRGRLPMVADLLQELEPSMLLVSNRNSFLYELWTRGKVAGAQVCCRVSETSALPNLGTLPDGSYRSRVYLGSKAQPHDVAGTDVRVVPCLDAAGEDHRWLVTTLLDPEAATAGDLAAASSQPQGIEPIFAELMPQSPIHGLVLRSKSPDLVHQETWSYLCVHHAIRWLRS
jgi:hypothetical protein